MPAWSARSSGSSCGAGATRPIRTTAPVGGATPSMLTAPPSAVDAGAVASSLEAGPAPPVVGVASVVSAALVAPRSSPWRPSCRRRTPPRASRAPAARARRRRRGGRARVASGRARSRRAACAPAPDPPPARGQCYRPLPPTRRARHHVRVDSTGGIERAAVAGAGAMGPGIAARLALGRHPDDAGGAPRRGGRRQRRRDAGPAREPRTARRLVAARRRRRRSAGGGDARLGRGSASTSSWRRSRSRWTSSSRCCRRRRRRWPRAASW